MATCRSLALVLIILSTVECFSTNEENEYGGDHLPWVDAFQSLSAEFFEREHLETSGTPLVRSKRKVISRGGHYIIRSKSPEGHSPWGAPRENYNYYTLRKRQGSPAYLGGWQKLPTGKPDEFEDPLTPYSSQTARRASTVDVRRKERQRISKSLKAEIAQYALKNGAITASRRYEATVGRRLKERIVEKFARRYKDRQQRLRRRKGN